MKIKDLKNKILSENKDLELELKKDLAFQVAVHLEQARILKGLTQKELAEKIGTTQSNIARAERGISLPSLSFLQKIAALAFDSYLIPPKFAFMEAKQVLSSTAGKNHFLHSSFSSGTLNQNYQYSLPKEIYTKTLAETK